MKAYWSQLNERERWLLGLCGLVCVFYLYFVLIYAPLQRRVTYQFQQLLEKQHTLVWMKEMHQQFKTQKHLKSLQAGPLLTLLAERLKQSAFQSFPYQLQQTGAKSIQLSFDQVPYNLFLSWLWTLQQSYVLPIEQLDIQRKKTSGIVALRIVFKS